VDRQPPQIHPPPRHLPSHASKISRPLLARVLLPPARRRFARTRAERSRAPARSRWQSKRTQDGGWQSCYDGQGSSNGTLGRDVFSREVRRSSRSNSNVVLCKSRASNTEQSLGRKQQASKTARVRNFGHAARRMGISISTRFVLASHPPSRALAKTSQKIRTEKNWIHPHSPRVLLPRPSNQSPDPQNKVFPLVYVQVENPAAAAGHSFVNGEGKATPGSVPIFRFTIQFFSSFFS
jgi:hypothetical protein